MVSCLSNFLLVFLKPPAKVPVILRDKINVFVFLTEPPVPVIFHNFSSNTFFNVLWLFSAFNYLFKTFVTHTPKIKTNTAKQNKRRTSTPSRIHPTFKGVANLKGKWK